MVVCVTTDTIYRFASKLLRFCGTSFTQPIAKTPTDNSRVVAADSPTPVQSSALDNASPYQMGRLVDRQHLEIEGPRARREAPKIAQWAMVRDLHGAALLSARVGLPLRNGCAMPPALSGNLLHLRRSPAAQRMWEGRRGPKCHCVRP